MAKKIDRQPFLDMLSELGRQAEVCRKLGLKPSTVSYWLQTDPAFKVLRDEAMQVYAARLEEEADRRGRTGWTENVYQKGICVGEITRYSDRLLEMLLRRHIPEFRDRLAVDATLSGGVLVVPAVAKTADEWKEEAEK